MAEAPVEVVPAGEQVAPKKRLENTELVVPICYGTVAFWLGKKADEYHSHRWTVYVRSPSGEELNHIISKVVFKLHDSFMNPIRVVEAAPYELTETGWGEFEISITMHFTEDSGEKPIEIFHPLKLYEDAGSSIDRQSTKKPVVTEDYDELVFSEPVQEFYERVVNVKPAPAPSSELTQHLPVHNDAEELAKIKAARRSLAEQIAESRLQLELGEAT